MKRINWILLFFLLPLSLLADAEIETRVKFTKGNLSAIKEQAKLENRPFFVDFTAAWCMPCRFMDETTFMDPTLADYIAKEYLAVKVDVDDFDGYAYKQQYNIQMVPSILVFSPEGKILARYKESLPPSKLLAILKEHDNYNSKPSGISKPSSKDNGSVITRPSLPSTTTTQIPQTTTPITAPSVPEMPVASGNGLFEFSVIRKASTGYGVQVGVYASYDNVLKEAAKFQEQFDAKVLVHIDNLNGKTVYRVLLGDYAKISRATKLKNEVVAAGIKQAFVKDLSILI